MSSTNGPDAPTTVARAFVDTATANADSVAIRWMEGDGFGEWTFAQYADLVARAAAGMKARGVSRGDRVVLMMRNTPHFHVLDIAALMVGATPVSIYNSSAPDQI